MEGKAPGSFSIDPGNFTALVRVCNRNPRASRMQGHSAIRRVCDDAPRPIGEINPEVPGWLIEIIGILLEKKPEGVDRATCRSSRKRAVHVEAMLKFISDCRHTPRVSSSPFQLTRRRLSYKITLYSLIDPIYSLNNVSLGNVQENSRHKQSRQSYCIVEFCHSPILNLIARLTVDTDA